MCELLGYTNYRDTDINTLLDQFFYHSIKNRQRDGWGLASYSEQGQKIVIRKEHCPAHKSKYLKKAFKGKIISNLAIGHLRQASRGAVNFANTHPFIQTIHGVDWALAHNGTMYLSNKDLYNGNRKIKGTTDSERILCFIADFIEQAPVGMEFEAIQDAIETLNEDGMLNLVITNGQTLFVYANRFSTLFASTHYKRCTILMTRPEFGLKWKPVETGKLLAFENGVKIKEGRRIYSYENLYFENEWEKTYWNGDKYFESDTKKSLLPRYERSKQLGICEVASEKDIRVKAH